MKKTSILPLEARFGDFKMYFNAAAIRYDSGVVLVDVGFPGFIQKLEEAMAGEGLALGDVKKIIVTHQDGDHIGSLKAILDKYPGIEVMCSAEQAPGITGEEMPYRLQLARKSYAASTSEEEKKELEEEMKRLAGIQTIDQVTVVKDREVLQACGIELLDISGHMPGHLCVYVPADKCLITGDALTARDGALCPPDPDYTLNMPMAIRSLEKLLDYEIENVICYHGGFVTGDIRSSLLAIIGNGKKKNPGSD
jgi:glyoxylase-like metal-dependent hydrolase (beta-lactamase superfamily II)